MGDYLKPWVTVALCADKNFEVGLHVTLFSLLLHCSSPVRIYLIHKGYKSNRVSRIQKTLAPFEGKYELKLIEFDNVCFKGLRLFHGNTFIFTKLMLANLLLDEKNILYLDSDLVVKIDVTELYNEDCSPHLIGVSGVDKIRNTIDNNFFTSLGLSGEAKYFNSGVLLLDCEKWRQERVTERALQFAEKYPKRLLAADQTVLNYLFYEERFHVADPSYNIATYPMSEPVSAEKKGIFHLLGAPKPWDYFGAFLHTNYNLYYELFRETYFRNRKLCNNLSYLKLKRTPWLVRSYYYCIKKRLSSSNMF